MAASLVRISSRRVAGILARREISSAYVDRLDYPAPPRRFVEDAALPADSKALREKEQGDWSALSQEEKIGLYRLSFQKTFAEMNAPTGEWKFVLGGITVCLAVAFILFGLQKKFIAPPSPPTMSKEYQDLTMKYNIAIRNNPMTGIASQWDYEKNDWKK